MNERFLEIVCDVLDVKKSDLSPSSTPDDVDAWDSLSHLRLVTAIEQEFNVRLSMSEIEAINSLGALQAIIEERA